MSTMIKRYIKIFANMYNYSNKDRIFNSTWLRIERIYREEDQS